MIYHCPSITRLYEVPGINKFGLLVCKFIPTQSRLYLQSQRGERYINGFHHKTRKGLSMRKDKKHVFESTVPVSTHTNVIDYLGEGDAASEWSDIDKITSVFLQTDDYTEFKKINRIVLFGLRGTGKTAMINMLNYEISNNLNRNYKYSLVLKQNDAYNDLANSIQSKEFKNIPKTILIHNLIRKWRWIITISIMQDLIEKRRSNYPSLGACANDDLDKIEMFLKELKLADSNYPKLVEPIKYITDGLTEELSFNRDDPTQVIINVLNNRLYTSDYEIARKVLIKIIKNNLSIYLIMIDSMESYDIKDKILNAITTSLIEVAQDFYINLDNDKILVKIALPLEIDPELTPMNRDKLNKRKLIIHWGYKELFSLIAKRYWYFYNNNTYVHKELENYETAKYFLYHHFVDKIVTSNSGIEYDTFDYILRHTQKKPRQIIDVFNSILTVAALDNKGYPPFNMKADHIKRGVHSIINELAIGTLNIYEHMYPGFTKYVQDVFAEKPQCMKMKSVEKFAIGQSGIETSLSLPRRKNVLFECGLLGLDVNHKRVDSGKTCVESLFSYFTHESLPITKESPIVIHPMFYRYLRTKLDTSLSVFPVTERKLAPSS